MLRSASFYVTSPSGWAKIFQLVLANHVGMTPETEWYNKYKRDYKCLYQAHIFQSHHVIEGVNFTLVVLSPGKGGFVTGFIGRLGRKFEACGLQGLPDRPSLYERS